MNDELEKAIQQQWGRYSGWEPGRVQEFANILRSSGISNLGDISNARLVETPDAFTDYQGGNLEANDPGTVISRAGYQLQVGDKNLGFLGNINREGQFEGKQGQYLQETYDPNAPYRLGWSAQGKGNVSYNLVKGPDGKYVVVPQWASSSDAETAREVAKGAMTIGSMAAGLGAFNGIGGAGTTFGNVMKGANALYNASQGNYLGAIAGAAGLGGEYMPEYASTFKDIGQTAKGIQALQNLKENPLGSLYSLTSIGADRPELSEYSKTLKDIGGGINVARALGSGQYGAALTGLGSLVGEGDLGKGLTTAGTGLKLAQTASNLRNNPLAAVSLAQAGSRALSGLGSNTGEAKMGDDDLPITDDWNFENVYSNTPQEDEYNPYVGLGQEDAGNDFSDIYSDPSRQQDIYKSPEPSFMDRLNKILSGKSDYGQLGRLGAFGLAGLLLSQANKPKAQAPAGYQGSIPLYSMSRTQNQQPAYTSPWAPGATRRPGQGGINYFSAPEFKKLADAIPAGYAGGIGSLSRTESALPAEPPSRVQDMMARLSPEERMILAQAASSPNRFAAGGMPDMYARGRFVSGQGDGVSDHVPATIEGNQPARLADGEFVLPARIVSEIGNGSSAAGARKLYAFMDRVERMAKTAKRGKPSGADRLLNRLT